MADRSPLVVVGDALLDLDVRGTAERLCPDAPAPVVAVGEERARPGGAALAAALAVAMGSRPVRLVTALAGDSGARLRDLLEEAGVEVVDLGRARPTPVKQRVLAGDRCVLRLDHHDERAAPDRPEGAEAALRGAAAVLAADYGRGVLADERVRRALGRHRAALVWDPHPCGPAPLPGAALVTPNHREAAVAAGTDGTPDALSTAVRAATELVTRWDVRAVAVTRGVGGAVLVDRSGAPRAVPARLVEGPADTCGAGDAFAATAALALAAGELPTDAVARGVEGATAFVAAGGAAGWSDGRARRAGGAAVDPVARPTGVVATSGCFDIVHAGHVAFLEGARRLGSRLVVLLNSDESVRRLKGPDRPLQAQADRAAVLRSLAAVDDVVVFDEVTPAAALAQLRPDIFVKGGDYTVRDLPEAEVVSRWGGTTVTLPYLPGRSTTRLIQEARRHGPVNLHVG